MVQEQCAPRIIWNLLLEAPLSRDAILGNQSTLRLRCDSWTKSGDEQPLPAANDLGSLDASTSSRPPALRAAESLNLAQTQFTPNIIRNLLSVSALRLAHSGQRQHAADLLQLLVQGRTPATPSAPILTGQRVTAQWIRPLTDGKLPQPASWLRLCYKARRQTCNRQLRRRGSQAATPVEALKEPLKEL